MKSVKCGKGSAMLKEVGASGQISLGKKYAGQLFEVQFLEDGRVQLMPVKVVPAVQEELAAYPTGDGWLTPERLARRKAAAARTAEQVEAARTQWEEENKEAIEAMNQRMAKIGSMGRRLHEWRKEKAAREQVAAQGPADKNA
ncbi:MAG: hypothetical protein ACREXN_09060 [Polaromonas sp.]